MKVIMHYDEEATLKAISKFNVYIFFTVEMKQKLWNIEIPS